MKKQYLFIILVLTFILLTCILFIFFNKNFKYRRQVNALKKWKLVSPVVINHFDSKNIQNIPYFDYVSVALIIDPPITEHFRWYLRWYEYGFNSAGINIYYTDCNQTEVTYKLPFPNDIWSKKERDLYGEGISTRQFYIVGTREALKVYDFDINKFSIPHRKLEIPSCLFDNPIFLSIYDNNGRESNRLKCGYPTIAGPNPNNIKVVDYLDNAEKSF